MRFKSASVPSSKGRDFSATGSRLKKKHKRLDAICENVYKQNHSESNERKGGDESASVANLELRRSSRVRRAPVLLDASPSPVKKRRKVDKNVNLGVDENLSSTLGSIKDERENENLGNLDNPGSWRSRLRSRGRNFGNGLRRNVSGRRKLFDVETVEGELDEKKGELNGGKSMVVRSKRPGRVKAVNGLGSKEREDSMQGGEDVMGKNEGEICIGKEESRKDAMEVVGMESEEGLPALGSDMGGENEEAVVGNGAVQLPLDEEEDKQRLDDLVLDNSIDANEDVENAEQSDTNEELDSGKNNENENAVEDGALTNHVEGGEFRDEEEGGFVDVDEMPLEGEKNVRVEKLERDSTNNLGRPLVKQGRHCGLCGCGNDGKLPRRLVQDAGESENEAYSGSSASEEPNYDMWDGFGDEPEWLGRLLGPVNDRYGIAGIWVHQQCAVWSPEVYFAGLGCLKNVRAALCRGRALKCSRCGRPRATIGCRVDRCPKTYHLPCARADGCIFDHRKFLIACTDHRHLFQPHGNQYLERIKKLKAKKMKLEMRKLSNDALRKDVEAEEKWLENCGEDEEFLKRESKRLQRDLLRIAPVYIGGSNSESGKLFEGWESVAGLQNVIQCMKEVVILPLLYPEFFTNLGITPPRGVLLHGYPGTGKTLVVRALIGSCARGDKRIAYFARKGADCLGKYVGDAERQLRLLFQVAERCQPSIIFFDEIDGLAPCRTRRQDQTHNSVVSTLLALMDGLKSRGSVVVIGATNRPEAVDPALRRPGRFDREIYFPLPSVEDRAAILSLHTKMWPKPVSGPLLQWIAKRTVGFTGADLQALCTEAAIIALKRNFPLHKILSAAGERTSGAKRLPLPAFSVEERDWLEALACAPPPCSHREAGIAAYDLVSSPLPIHLIPCLLQPLSILLVSLYLDERLWLPSPLLKAAKMIKSVIVSSLEKKNLLTNSWWSHVDNFLKEADSAEEIQKSLSRAGILIGETAYDGTDAFTDETDCGTIKYGSSVVHNRGRCTNFFRSVSFGSRKKSGFRVLIAGGPRCGQRHLASCILHCFLGNIEIQKIDLATVSQEGHGDMVQGLTQVLMKCASLQSCMIFMPRIDLWAVETCHQVTRQGDVPSINQQLSEETEFFTHSEVEEEIESSMYQSKAAKMARPQVAPRSASHGWSSFVEQVESICVSTSLMILATSEIPVPELPRKIMEFFNNGFSNSSHSTPSERTEPLFSVNVDGNFNRDTIIRLSTTELLRDIMQPFVQLIHQKSHIVASPFEEYKISDYIQGHFVTEGHRKNHHAVGQNEDRAQCPYNFSLEVPPLPISRSSKGKSSLLLAISTFGYQILRYPHFAELCWITSKLKEGPYADVSGPWKGWPFNACIIRPNHSVDKGAVVYGLDDVKNKEKTGLVRGLIAVGLNAHRGAYKSLNQVCFEVRKVLELLVRQVNEKIQAGKDRYQYVRVLSQVAYLEDMVNSWAYALQSLELDTQMKVANPKPCTMEFPDADTCQDNSVQNEKCEENTSNRSSHESEGLEGSRDGLAPENLEAVDLNKGDGFCCHNSEGRAVVSEDGSARHMNLSGQTILDENLQSSGDNQSVGNIANEQNGTARAQWEPENTKNLSVGDGNSRSLKHSNGFALKEPALSDNGSRNADELDAYKFAGPSKSCGRVNGLGAMEGIIRSEDAQPDSTEHINDINLFPIRTTDLRAGSGVVCLYRCCSGCIYALHKIIQKILTRAWGLNKSHGTAEDVHDVVTSLSIDLLSAVRKVDIAENQRCGNLEGLSERPELPKCHCRSSGHQLVLPVECGCHSMNECATSNTQSRLDWEFVFRDGVLVSVDSNKDVSFHCKYETLCLCSLIESIVMMKQPFD